MDPNQGEPWGRYTPRHDPRSPVALPYALRAWRKYLRQLERAAGARLFWFYGIEYGERFGRLHVHALTGNTERVPTGTLASMWAAGWSRNLVYDPNKGAGWYLAKYMAPWDDLAEWDISDSPADAKAWWVYRNSDRAQVEQLTRAAQARLRARDRHAPAEPTEHQQPLPF